MHFKSKIAIWTIDGLSIKDIGFEGKTAAEVNDIYHTIYAIEDEVKYGVVAFKFQLL